ncbi:GAP family protein [Glutamicibacter protophormiae]|uniref:GAP family protein n=1 Tax=Glutamicibacter protophormiae TaxID=37930 RepID=UPI00195CCF4B|nr:GAP family protein [Glutamicibacter protophormiae]QRQ79347.1 GAP family protein [Glutamicibacter protophormiae]
MDIFTNAAPVSLVVLALIDATSIGTLVIPIWLLLRRDYRRSIPRVLLYLGLLAGFYWVIGLVLRSGFALASSRMSWDIPVLRLLGLAVGAGMIIWALSYRTDAQKLAAARKAGTAGGVPADDGPGQGAGTGQPQVSGALRRRLGTALDTRTGVVVLALLAGLLELPTMLPYLGAMGVLQGTGWSAGAQALVLAGYCLVMIAPALVLVGVRRAAGDRIERWLQAAGRKLGRYAQETLGWVVGIAGYLMIRFSLDGVQLRELVGSVLG